MIWIKTEAGRSEMQARTLVNERPKRNLLLVIDGSKSEEMLLLQLAGISANDFVELHSLGLIAPLVEGVASQQGWLEGTAAPGQAASAVLPAAAAPPDYAEFTATLTTMISQELGLRGFVLTLAVEKARTAEELQSVAHRAIDQIRERRGDAAAVAARRALYGG